MSAQDVINGKLGGRPALYASEEVEPLVQSYFSETPQEEWTITGLGLACGFISRQMFNEYSEREGFGYLKRARTLVEMSYERSLRSGNSAVAGAIFALKNMGWVDRQDITSGGERIEPLQIYLPSKLTERQLIDGETVDVPELKSGE